MRHWRMLDLTLDPATETRLVSRFGPGFHDWFAALPALLERLARRWDLEIVAAVTAGNTSRTFHVRRAGGVPAFLKLTPSRRSASPRRPRSGHGRTVLTWSV
ncbi:hypothetical protein ACFQX6_06490 [Streptosporangium lutulentum]